MKANNKSTNVGYSVFVNEACPNIDYKYGLYNSVEEAYEALGENGDDVIALGLTVGIKTENGVVEYWWKNGTALEDLVPKNDNSDIEQKIIENERVTAAALNELKDKIASMKNATEHVEAMFPVEDADGNGIPDGIDKLNKLEEAVQDMTEDEVSDVWNETFGE